LHKEFHEQEYNRAGGVFHMVQLWVNLPAKDKMTQPKYQALAKAEMGRVELPKGGEVEIIAGEFNGIKGPGTTFTPVNMFNVRPAKGETVELEFPANFTTFVLAIEGSGRINGTGELKTDHLALLATDGERFTIEATEGNSTFLVLSGEPIDEPIASYGPFLMNTQAELAQAIDDFNSGKFGRL